MLSTTFWHKVALVDLSSSYSRCQSRLKPNERSYDALWVFESLGQVLELIVNHGYAAGHPIATAISGLLQFVAVEGDSQ